MKVYKVFFTTMATLSNVNLVAPVEKTCVCVFQASKAEKESEMPLFDLHRRRQSSFAQKWHLTPMSMWYPTNLVPRGRDPSGLRQESRPLG